MAFHGEVEAAQAVAREGVSTALQNNRFGLIALHHTLDYLCVIAGGRQYRFENCHEIGIVDTCFEREVEGVPLTFAVTDILMTMND